MATKSLTITEDAYEVLRRLKTDDESFSEVIMRIGAEKRDILLRYLGAIDTRGKNTAERVAAVRKRRKRVDHDWGERRGGA